MMLATVASHGLSAQGTAAASDRAACSYAQCALGISPVLSGLDLVRGARNERVGTLNFFWPHSVRPFLLGNDSSVYHADRALHARVIGAALTDVAGVIVAIATVRAVRDHGLQGNNIGLALGGVALLGVSVPFQFSADAHLSRAVWWYNAALAR
ncbi:MAG: hypothetical protein ABJE47_09900 [bacterium]